MGNPSALNQSGFDASGSYEFGDLEGTYGKFLAPCFVVSIGGTVLDSTKIPISSIQVNMEESGKASGCSLTINAMYNYETGQWAEGLLDKVAVGQKLNVAGGYADQQKILFKGLVDDFSLAYSSGGAPQLTVHGIDGLALLMNNDHQREFDNKAPKDIVTEIIQDCLDQGVVESTKIGGLPESFTAQFDKPESITDFNYLKMLSEKFGLFFQIINNELLFTDEPMNNTNPLITLTMGVSLYSFTKNLRVTRGTVGTVAVQAVDRENETRYYAEVSNPSISFGSGETAVKRAKAFGVTRREFTEDLCKSNEDCKAVAQAILDRMAMEYISGSGRCVGIPDLIPARFIKLERLDSKTNGLYLISSVTHSFTSEGYFTDFNVKGLKS